jgi:hypothetical protein
LNCDPLNLSQVTRIIGMSHWHSASEFPFSKMRKVLEMDSGDGYTAMWMYLIFLSCIIKMAKWYTLCILYHNKN